MFLFICFLVISEFLLMFQKDFIRPFLVSILSFSALSMENNNANGKSILDIQSGSAIEKIMIIELLNQLFTKLICMVCFQAQ